MGGSEWRVTVIAVVIVAGVWLGLGRAVAVAADQTTQAPPAGAAPEQPTQPDQSLEAEAPIQPEAYSYDPAGRRDPFVSLLNRGIDLGPSSDRPAGLEGLSINEVALRGIVMSRGNYLAILEAPDSKTYIIRAADRLLDGSVRSITADTVVFLQEVNDPLSLEKAREVRRMLRSIEEAR